MNLVKGSLSIFVAQIMNAGMMFFSSIMTARILGPAGRGEYTLIILVPTMLFTVGHLAIGQASVYFMNRKKLAVSEAVSYSLVLSVVMGCVLVLGGVVFVSFLKTSFYQEVNRVLLHAALLIVPFELLYHYLMWILLGKNRVRDYICLYVCRPSAHLALLLLLVMSLKLGVAGATSSFIISLIFSCFLSVLLVRRVSVVRWRVDLPRIRDAFGFGLRSHLGNIAQFLNYRLSFFLVGYFLGVGSVGLYSVTVTVAETLWYIPSAVAAMLLPKIASGEDSEADSITPVLSRNVLLVTIAIGFIYAVASRAGIQRIFGSDYIPSIAPLIILLPGAVVFSVPKVIASNFIGRGRPLLNAYVAFAALGFNILLAIWLIPKHGIAGAALATTGSYLGSFVITLVVFARISARSIRDIIIPRKSDFGLYRGLLSTARRKIGWRSA